MINSLASLSENGNCFNEEIYLEGKFINSSIVVTLFRRVKSLFNALTVLNSGTQSF